MRLAETHYDNTLTGCCAPVDLARWDRQEHHWHGQRFLVDRVHELFHIPLDFGAVMRRDAETVERAAAWPAEPFTLSDEVSPWGADLYTAIDADIPGAHTTTLSGTFLSRVFEGPFKEIPRWIKEMDTWVHEHGATTEHLYFSYATCPACAKKLGKNQVVLVARISAEA